MAQTPPVPANRRRGAALLAAIAMSVVLASGKAEAGGMHQAIVGPAPAVTAPLASPTALSVIESTTGMVAEVWPVPPALPARRRFATASGGTASHGESPHPVSEWTQLDSRAESNIGLNLLCLALSAGLLVIAARRAPRGLIRAL